MFSWQPVLAAIAGTASPSQLSATIRARQHRADACLGWLAPADQALPAPLDVMSLGRFEPDAWIPSSHPAARQDVISLGELTRLNVVHGPRRATPGIYDAWLACLRSADSRFEFADPPFRQSLSLALALRGRPAAVPPPC